MVECLTIGPRVRASPASLRCVLEQDTGSTQEDKPYIAVRLLMGRKESNQTEKNYVIFIFLSSGYICIYITWASYLESIWFTQEHETQASF